MVVKHNRTVRRKKRNQAEPDRIKDAELEHHRRAFLGEPGSKKWQEYHQGLLATKQRLFGGDANINQKSRSTARNYGGDPSGNEIKEDDASETGEKDASKPGENDDSETGDNENDDDDSEGDDNQTADPAATQKANALLRKKIHEIKTENGDPIPEEALKIKKLNMLCSAIVKGSSGEKYAQQLIDLREGEEDEPGIDDLVLEYNDNPEPEILEELKPLLEEYEKLLIEINRGNIIYKSNNAAKQDRISKMFGVHWLADIVGEDDMKLLMEFAKLTSEGSPIKVPDAWSLNDDKKPFDFGYETLKNQINAFPPTSEEVKIEYIPFFLQVYLRLISALDEKKKQSTTDMDYRMKKNDPEDVTSLRTIRRLILFSIRILRDMNMYVNPLFFDDLYYYYYFLQLDRILPSLDSMFRGVFSSSKPEKPEEKGAQVTMRVTEQAASDNNPEKKKYGVEFRERFFNYDPIRDFDMWLNMIRVRPNYDSVPGLKEVSANFKMTPKPDARKGEDPFVTEVSGQTTKNDNSDKKVEDENNKSTKGQKIEEDGEGDLEEDLGEEDGEGGEKDENNAANNQSGGGESNYHFLEDNPLARRFEDLSEELSPSYQVHLCIYSLDRSCKTPAAIEIPFVKYITQKSEDKWSFPSFQYDLAENGAESNDNDFQCETFTRLLESLGLSLCGTSDQSAISGGGVDSKPENAQPVEEPTLADENAQSAAEDNAQSAEEPPLADENAQSAEEAQPTEEVQSAEAQPIEEVQPTEEPPLADENAQSAAEDNAQSAEEPPLADENAQPTEEPPLADENAQPTEEPPLADENAQPASNDGNKNKCESMESAIESIYQGMVLKKMDDGPHIFVFFNYDVLMSMTKQDMTGGEPGKDGEGTNAESGADPEQSVEPEPASEPGADQPSLEPEPASEPGADPEQSVESEPGADQPSLEQEPALEQPDSPQIFCSSRPKITDEDESDLRWATVDELIFQKKMLGQPIDPIISDAFKTQDILWNITDATTGEYIDFPFVVYGVKETADNVFATVTVEDGKDAGEESILSVKQTGQYGTSGLSDQYGMRYCFTIQPFDSVENGKRFVLFALNPEYLVEDAELDSLPAPQSGGEPAAESPAQPVDNTEVLNNSENTIEEPAQQIENPDALNNSETPIDNPEATDNSVDTTQQIDNPDATDNSVDPEATDNPEDQTGAETLGDPNQEIDESMTNSAQIPTIYCVTNNAFTKNTPYVTWAIFKQTQFCGL